MTSRPIARSRSRRLGGAVAALWLAASPAQALPGPVELGRLDGVCCPSGVDRTGSHAVASYADPDELLGLRVFDLADPGAPVLVAELPLAVPARGLAISAAGYAYVAAGDDGLRIVDVSSPTSPVAVGAVPIPGEAVDVLVSGARAYVETSDAGLRVLDLTVPTAPVEVGSLDSLDLPFPWTAQRPLVDVAVGGDVVGLCFGATPGGAAVVHFVDFSSPGSPVPLGTEGLGSPPEWAPGCNRIASSGTHFYTDHGYVSLSQPEPLEADALLEYPAGDYSTHRVVAPLPDPGSLFQGIAAPGSIVHVARGGRLQSFDPALSSAGALQSDVDLASALGPVALAVAGGLLVGTADTHGIAVVDVSDPADPSLPAYETAFGGDVDRVAIDGGIAMLITSFEGIRIVDVGDPAALVARADWPLAAVHGAVQGATGFATVVSQPAGLQLFDLSTPDSPLGLGFLPMAAGLEDLEVSGAYAFLAAGTDGLRIVDASDPLAPFEASSFVPPGNTREVEIRGNLALVLAEDGQPGPPFDDTVSLVDVSDPSAPVGLAQIGGLARPMTAEVIGDHLLVFTNGQMEVFDISTPTAPAAGATVPFPYFKLWGYEADRHGTRVLVPLKNEVVVVDASDPAAPFVADTWLEGATTARNVVVRDGVLFRAETTRGLASYALEPQAIPVAPAPLLGLLAALLVCCAHRALRPR